ncbi:MAG: hypothetical protein BMS9Abin06_0602 [Gammaproteobacteria bacterium]|nr:MAG: hypothetical protein BMS9Abin06_0602 [Gammaproteobacteria bacterium]
MTSRNRWAISSIYAYVFICALGAMTSAEAVTITGISGNYQISGYLSDPIDGVVFDETVVSTDVEGQVIVQSNLPNSYHGASGSINNTILSNRIATSVYGAVRSPGLDYYASLTLSYALVFSIDAAADFSLYSSSSSWWPRASSDNGDAFVNVSLKRLDNSVIFNYDAPSTGVDGPYASGTISAGTYQLLIDGFVEAIGRPASGSDPFAPATNGQSIAGLNLGLSDAAVVPVPAAVWLFGSGLVGLVGIARRRKAA